MTVHSIGCRAKVAGSRPPTNHPARAAIRGTVADDMAVIMDSCEIYPPNELVYGEG